ncbi:MAG: hypothetical protein KatS3mg077_1178 [Candidatus Binatia bacterium]|nr:MAG: hypothetical protein KatS3mg077_1178 [Candidatus Binatia bacterium]
MAVQYRCFLTGRCKRGFLVASTLAVAVGWMATGVRAQLGEPLRLVSGNPAGQASNGTAGGVGVDREGNLVGFYSDASNIVPLDTNQVRDVFVRDVRTGTTERVSVSSTGAQANGPSHLQGGNVSLSGDGNLVVFYSAASNLVAGDTNGQPDVFVRRRAERITERISVASDGTQANGANLYPAISGDGRWVAFQSDASNLVPGDTNRATDIFVRDLNGGTTERLCNVQGNGPSSHPAISEDGSVVAFSSAATNLVAGDTNGRLDIFVCDRASGTIEIVSVASDGRQGNGDSILPAISADGRFVAFKSLADNLVPNDRNGVVDVFVFDRQTRTIERVSVNTAGENADDFSFPPAISADGRFVAFGSAATNLIFNDANHASNMFVRDRQIGRTLVVDVNDRGELADGGVPDAAPAISGRGTRVAFVSFATNLVPGGSALAGQAYLGQNPFFGPGACPDGICPEGLVCVAGFCLTPTRTPTVTRTATPTYTRTPTRTATPTPTFRPCESDADCPPDQHCRGGTCKKKRECDDEDPTVDRLNCFDREACVNGLCECGGDCNLDGFVFGNEVSNAVYILGDVLPLSQCAAADLNGDGQVMGNEITQIVLNLARGCVQEGRPLTFAHDRGQTVTLAIDARSAEDGSVEVTVNASGGGGELATVQLDLLFDPNILEIGDPGRACRLDERLRSTHVLLATLPHNPPAAEGTQRLRLFAGDLSFPIQSFEDGAVFHCKFQRVTAQSGEAAFGADRTNVGDARADTFRVVVASAGLTLGPPAVTEPTPVTSCAGDCDGNGQVMGNEITTVVQIMASRLPLGACPNADADGDGEVTVGDVTKAVIRLARGCP